MVFFNTFWSYLTAFVVMIMITVNLCHANTEILIRDIRSELIKQLQDLHGQDLDVKNIRVLKGLDILSDKTALKLHSLILGAETTKNSIQFAAIVTDKMQSKYTIQLEAIFDQLVTVYMASKPLQKGSIVNKSDFYTVKTKASRLTQNTITKSEDIEGKVLKISIAQNVIFRYDHLTDQSIVKRGSKVDIEVQGTYITISSKGILKTDTPVGSIATVYCETSKKELTGIMSKDGKVRVGI